MVQKDRHKGTAVDYRASRTRLPRSNPCCYASSYSSLGMITDPCDTPGVDAGRLPGFKALNPTYRNAGQVGKLLLGPLVLDLEGFDDTAHFFRRQQAGACGGFALHPEGVRPG